MRDVLKYCLAAVLLLASVPLYYAIYENSTRPDAPAEVEPPPASTPARPLDPMNFATRAPNAECSGTSGQPAKMHILVTDHANCMLVLEAIMAIDRDEAQCLGGRFYSVHRSHGVLDVKPWHAPVTCQG